MKKFCTLAVALLLLCLTFELVIAADSKSVAVGVGVSGELPQATQEGIVAWADKYYEKYEPLLKGDNKEAIKSMKTAFFMNKGSKVFMDETVSELVSALTISLSSKKSFDMLVTASALLVKTDPKNPRAINLFGAVLNSAELSKEALLVFEYGVSIKPKNPLLRLNLANAYLDADKDDLAKDILDRLSFEYSNDRAVWKAMAAYYYKKKDMNQFRECLFKAAQFKGYAKKKIDKKRKKVDVNTAEASDSPAQLEPKLKELETSEPFTSADILEDEYPVQAQQIREKYCKLQDDVKWRMPKLPQCNTSTPKDYRISYPIIKEWVNVFKMKQMAWSKAGGAKYGIVENTNAKKRTDDLKRDYARVRKEMGTAKGENYKVLGAQANRLHDQIVRNEKNAKQLRQKQAKKAAQVQVNESMRSAQEMLKNMQKIPGMKGVNSKTKINQAMKKLQEAAKKQNVKLPKEPPKSSGDDEEEAEDEEVMKPDMSKMIGYDSGSPWAQVNYTNYLSVKRTYELYLVKYFKRYNAEVLDIQKNYAKRVQNENDYFSSLWKQLQKQHKMKGNPHGDKDIPCRQAQLRHKKTLNNLAREAYIKWVNMYMPEYAQKMKPTLDAYWDVCMIHVRSMNDPKVMAREFDEVKKTFVLYSLMAGSAMEGGNAFKYYEETDEEERQLEADLAAAREEAQKQAPVFAEEYKSPEFDITKWIEDHFVIDIAISAPGFPAGLGFKVTAKTIQFDANAIIFGGTIKYNPVDNILETSSGLTVKSKIGINVCGIGGEVGGKIESYKRTATWDFDNNTYKETDSASGEVKFKLGPSSLGGKLELDSELNAKTTSKANFLDAFTVQEQAASK